MTRNKIEITDDVQQSLESEKVVPMQGIHVNGKNYFPKKHVKSGTKGVVWEGRDEYNYRVAIKFTIPEDYKSRSFVEEAVRASRLKEYPGFFALFENGGLLDLALLDGTKKCFVCFVEEWIEELSREAFGWSHLSLRLYQSHVRSLEYSEDSRAQTW